MAMNGDTLGDEIRAAIDAVVDKTDREALFQAMGNAIVTHITTNGTVNLNALFTTGVPTPNDGGAALQNTWKVAGAQSSVLG